MQKRPDVVKGDTCFFSSGCGNIYITVNDDEEGKVFECFVSIGKAGGCASSQSEAIGRLVSGWFRSGGSLHDIIGSLKGIRCHTCDPEQHRYSCADAVARALEKHCGVVVQDFREEHLKEE
jgi:ribonucleoside-diphosphate reductase alpha chain